MIIQREFNGFKTKLEFVGYTTSELETIIEAVECMTISMGSPHFETFCREYSYEIELTKRKCLKTIKTTQKYLGFHMAEGLTGYQVYTRLMKGAEMEPSETPEDNEADIFLKVDRSYNPGVIGYTYSNTKWQWIYQRILDDWGAQDIAGNLAHEWCHKVGFEHESSWNSKRIHSVPYAIGIYVRKYTEKSLI